MAALLLSLAFLTTVNAASLAARQQAAPNFAANIVDLGVSTDPAFQNIYRDGGGGVTLNGYNLIVFSDTYTTKGNESAPLTSFKCNTAAYFGAKRPNNPTLFTDFATTAQPGIPKLQISFMANETHTPGGRYVIWPGSNMVAVNRTTAIGAFPFGENLSTNFGLTNGSAMYNTLVAATIKSPASGGPVFERLVQGLFYQNEVQFGSFCMFKPTPTDGYIYLLGYDVTGIKVARVSASSYTDRAQYKYWNGKVWAKNLPTKDVANGNIINYTFVATDGSKYGPLFGDVFYSPYFNTLIAVFMDAYLDGIFYIAYSTTGAITGPWSNPQVLYQTPSPPSSWNYAGHAYPGWDPSGKTLLLSYTYGAAYTRFANVTWTPAGAGNTSSTSSSATLTSSSTSSTSASATSMTTSATGTGS